MLVLVGRAINTGMSIAMTPAVTTCRVHLAFLLVIEAFIKLSVAKIFFKVVNVIIAVDVKLI